MRDALGRAISYLCGCLGVVALVAGSASAETTDYCRTISDADAEKLKGRSAVVADIDGVLGRYVLYDYGPTNGAFLDEGIAFPRDDAALMLNIYHRRGYAIVYMAGRPRQIAVNGESMCEATLNWLNDNGFPTESGDTLLLLRDGDASVVDVEDRGTAMAEWMGKHGTDLFISFVDEAKSRFGIVPSYGYVDSAVVADAFIAVGVEPANVFTIGNKGVPRLGYRGTTPIVGEDANDGYTDHVKSFVVPNVPVAE